MVYTSTQNALIKNIASLKDKKQRALQGLYIAEGIKMVSEAVKFNKDIVYIVCVSEMLNSIPKTSAQIIEVSEKVYKFISDEVTPQGVLAVIKMPSLEVKAPSGNCLLLDGVSDPGNLGTIIRTACAFGYNDIYMLNCADAFSNKVVRASMSGIYNVNLYKGDILSIKNALKDYSVIAGDIKGENLDTFTKPSKVCIAVGNEANGLSSDVKELASNIVTIKMEQNQESLNVAIACAILMYKLK